MTSHHDSSGSLLQRLHSALQGRFLFSGDMDLDEAVDHADLGRRLRALEHAQRAETRPLGSTNLFAPAWRSYGFY